MTTKSDGDILLDKIASSMGAKVVSWNNINETIDRDISFAEIVDTSKYMSKEECKRIEQRSYIGK